MAYSGLIITWFINLISLVWSYQTLPDSGCKVLVPVELKKEVRLIPTDQTPITYYQYVGGALTDSISGLVFTLDHYYFFEDIDINDTSLTNSMLRESVDQILSSINGQIIYYDFQNDYGSVSMVWKAEYSDQKNIAKGVATIFQDAYYGLQTFGIKEKKPEDQMVKYLDSFKRTPPTK